MTSPRFVLLPFVVVIAVAVLVAGLVVGAGGAWGALVGGVLAGLFLLSTPAVLGPVATVMPGGSMALALLFFGTKMIALLAAFVVLLDTDGVGRHLDRGSLALTVVVAALAWTLLQLLAARRSRVPLYDLGDNP